MNNSFNTLLYDYKNKIILLQYFHSHLYHGHKTTCIISFGQKSINECKTVLVSTTVCNISYLGKTVSMLKNKHISSHK